MNSKSFKTNPKIMTSLVIDFIRKSGIDEADKNTLLDQLELIKSQLPVGNRPPESFTTLTDAYKETHPGMIDPDIEYIQSYLESRGVSDKGVTRETEIIGTTMILAGYFSGRVITPENIPYGVEFCKRLFGADYFFKKGFEDLYKKYDGRLPVKIKAVEEGHIIPCNNVLMVIENTDPDFPWIVNFLETLLLNGLWYPITVGSTSFAIKKLLTKWAKKTGSNMMLEFHLNDFGYRGTSSVESAGIGGCAHLANFFGTDTLRGIEYADWYYDAQNTCDIVGMSVPASEHSATIGWGKDRELEAYKHMLTQYPNGLISIVSDSYDLYNAVDNIFGKELKSMILNRNGRLVVRPDSGYPPQIIVQVLNLLDKNFGSTTNDFGYKVLNDKVRIIYGDFIKYSMIDDICEAATNAGYCIDNFVFGMGGALLQQVNRDTYKFAFKTNAVKRKGDTEWIGVCKTPVTTTSTLDKTSKAGRLMLIKNHNGEFETIPENTLLENENWLKPVFLNGEILRWPTFQEIRNRINSYIN